MRELKQKKLEQSSTYILEIAWLFYQELMSKSDIVPSNTLKALQKEFQSGTLSDLERRVKVLRSSLLPSDHNGFLTFRSMKIYEDIVKQNKRIGEMVGIEREANGMLTTKPEHKSLSLCRLDCDEEHGIANHYV